MKRLGNYDPIETMGAAVAEDWRVKSARRIVLVWCFVLLSTGAHWGCSQQTAYEPQLGKDKGAGELRESKAEKEAEMTEARDDLQALQDRIAFLEEQLAEAQLATQRAEEMAVSLAGTAKATNDAAKAQAERLQSTQSELTAAKQEQVKQRRVQLEADDLLIQKMAVIAAQEQQIRQLTAEKAEMQAKLDQYLNQPGETAATTPPTEQDIKLKGQVTAVDIPNALAEISIGTANGVKEEMIFRVTRGDKFVCNILIVDVDTERAVGDIQLAQLSPRAGDEVSVNSN